MDKNNLLDTLISELTYFHPLPIAQTKLLRQYPILNNLHEKNKLSKKLLETLRQDDINILNNNCLADLILRDLFTAEVLITLNKYAIKAIKDPKIFSLIGEEENAILTPKDILEMTKDGFRQILKNDATLKQIKHRSLTFAQARVQLANGLLDELTPIIGETTSAPLSTNPSTLFKQLKTTTLGQQEKESKKRKNEQEESLYSSYRSPKRQC